MPRIELKNVSKIYFNNSVVLYALKDITLTIEDGDFLYIVGPSLCGKTTLLNVIAGLTRIESGEILVDYMPVKGPGTIRF
jgi:ABC-type sugar transport system ATPase subunit